MKANPYKMLDINKDFLKNYCLLERTSGNRSLMIFYNDKIYTIGSDAKIKCFGQFKTDLIKSNKLDYKFRCSVYQENNHFMVSVFDITD